MNWALADGATASAAKAMTNIRSRSFIPSLPYAGTMKRARRREDPIAGRRPMRAYGYTAASTTKSPPGAIPAGFLFSLEP
jgi:hypothetical protein